MSEQKRIYAVMGASGNIGRVLCEALIDGGAEVRALTRGGKRAQRWAMRGAIVKIGNFDDGSFLAEAFAGADGVFAMIPPDLGTGDYAGWQDRVGTAIAEAVKRSCVRRVINLSSVGAHIPDGTGPIKGLYKQERRLNQLRDVDILHLRPCFFMENFYGAIPAIKATGAHTNSLRGDMPIPMVATRDIGAKAAQLLLALDFEGQSAFELFGPRPYTLVEATQILGAAIGKPDLKYHQISYEQAERAMLGFGIKPDAVSLVIEMNRAFNEGRVMPTQPMTGEHAGPTTLEEFSKTWAQAYQHHNT